MRCNVAARVAVLGIVGGLAATGVLAEEARTIPMEREAIAEVFKLRDLMSEMQPSPQAKPIEAFEARDPAPAPPAQTDLSAFTRFVKAAVKQSYNKSYEDAYRILKLSIENVAEVGPFPPAIEAALAAAGKAGAAATNYRDAWGVLHVTLKALSDDAGAFGTGGFRELVTLGRKAAWDRQPTNGYRTLDAFLAEVQARPELVADPYHALALSAARRAGEHARDKANGWRHMDRSMKVFVESDGADSRKDYFRAALEGSYDCAAEDAFYQLRFFADALLASDVADGFDKLTLKTSIQAAIGSDSWGGQYRIMRDGFEGLLQN